MALLRQALFVWLVAAISLPTRADNVLFIGNSFTLGAGSPVLGKDGGLAALFQAIARAKGRHVAASAVAVGGKDWSYHLAQPATARALGSKTWTWVVLQDYSTRPTHVGDVKQFMRDGETFSKRIARTSPAAGILLFETWARPPGAFYNGKPGHDFSGHGQMTSELHQSYGRLRDDLAGKNSHRPVRVALVGTAFASAAAQFPAINLDCPDHHHASAEGSYLAVLVIYETIYHDSAKGAPTRFFRGALVIPADDAAKLQEVADEIGGGVK
ncbi:MAG: hypothetical protein LV480_11940 [Methylacidiphilales bacterium]|nr:hypothetical protein [Candidatus Methylacidiphilales bacterium]